MKAPNSPSSAIGRALRGIGLKQGRGKDFRVAGFYRRGERLYTYVSLRLDAEHLAAKYAERIERETDEAGFPFYVRTHDLGDGRSYVNVTNSRVYG